jgi:hypothetical protein
VPRRALTSFILAGVAAAFALPACGGPIQRDELQRGVQTLGSIAEEGRLLARDVARDRTKTTFVRVHARDLADEADHEAEKLADAQATGTVAVVKAQAVRLAQDVSLQLRDLQVTPGRETTGAAVAGRLTRLAGTAQTLEARL